MAATNSVTPINSQVKEAPSSEPIGPRHIVPIAEPIDATMTTPPSLGLGKSVDSEHPTATIVTPPSKRNIVNRGTESSSGIEREVFASTGYSVDKRYGSRGHRKQLTTSINSATRLHPLVRQPLPVYAASILTSFRRSNPLRQFLAVAKRQG